MSGICRRVDGNIDAGILTIRRNQRRARACTVGTTARPSSIGCARASTLTVFAGEAIAVDVENSHRSTE